MEHPSCDSPELCVRVVQRRCKSAVAHHNPHCIEVQHCIVLKFEHIKFCTQLFNTRRPLNPGGTGFVPACMSIVLLCWCTVPRTCPVHTLYNDTPPHGCRRAARHHHHYTPPLPCPLLGEACNDPPPSALHLPKGLGTTAKWLVSVSAGHGGETLTMPLLKVACHASTTAAKPSTWQT